MSSQVQAGPSGSKDQEKKGLGKLLSRAKTVFKRNEGTGKKTSTPLQPGSSAVVPTEPKSTSVAADKPAQKEPISEAVMAKKNKYEDAEGVTKIQRKDLWEERARKLGEKYGLEIKHSEWYSTEGTALRVEKPIRMRVHRTCASCGTSFSSAKECPGCGSSKYKRYPPKRTEAEKVASRERRAALIKANKENAPIVPDYTYDPKKEPVLKKPSKTGGQDLVHKKPRQRVRRTCHECQTLFTTGSKNCEKCSHTRCTDCPRDPPKKEKYPFGYPGDEFGPNAIPHHECHECKTMFTGGVPDGTPCNNCQHEKCVDCPRLKPRKVEPEPDPAILQSVQAKIEALKLRA